MLRSVHDRMIGIATHASNAPQPNTRIENTTSARAHHHHGRVEDGSMGADDGPVTQRFPAPSCYLPGFDGLAERRALRPSTWEGSMKRTFLLCIGAVAITVAATGCTPKKFANCTDVHKTYAGGIARPGYHQVGMVTKYVPHVDLALYNANSSMDRDHDGVACEA